MGDDQSLSARIAQRVASERRRGRGRAAVLSRRAEIDRALQDGWSVRLIWETLHAEGLDVGYHAFARAIRAVFHAAGPDPGGPPIAEPTLPSSAGTAPPPPAHAPGLSRERRPAGPEAPPGRARSPATAAGSEPKQFRHSRIPRTGQIY